MNYRFSLEEWSGDKPGGNKTICPQCGKRTFVRYVDTHTGEYLGDIVGRCERVNNCRYHLTPREFFDGLSEVDKKRLLQDWRDFPAKTEPLPAKRAIQFLDDDWVGRYKSGQSRLELFLRRRFPDKGEQISAVLEKYCVGCDERGRTVFWQIDADGHLRAGKIISYKQETGHRDKAEHPPFQASERRSAPVIMETDTDLVWCSSFGWEHGQVSVHSRVGKDCDSECVAAA